jgi:hypothetical protein
VVYNTIGGSSWKQPGDAVEWEITVPEMDFMQFLLKGDNPPTESNFIQKLYVNGEVPFSENECQGLNTAATSENIPFLTKTGSRIIFILKREKYDLPLKRF